MKRFVASVAAAGLLVAGALVVAGVTSSPACAQETEASVDESSERAARAGDILDEVVDGLVADGTLTEDQADPVKDAFTAKYQELTEEREARRAERQETRELIKGFLEDDVIDADELAQLPDDHRWFDDDGALADALDDGELTKDELREAIPGHTHRHSHRGGGASDDATVEETANA